MLAFLLPHTSTILLLLPPLLCLMLLSISSGRRRSSLVFIPLVSIFVSLLFNLSVAQTKAIQAVATTTLYFVCFPFVGDLRVRNGYLYFCLTFIFLSQISYLLGIPYINEFFERLYPISEEDIYSIDYLRENINTSNVLSFRLGGLYHNENQCAKYITFLLSFFLIVNQDNKMREIVPFMLVAFLGVLLTGSRTGFVVSVLIILFAFSMKRGLSVRYRTIVGLLAIIVFIYFVVNATGTLRSLDVEKGIKNSAKVKWDTFAYYIASEDSIVKLLFGYLDVSLFKGSPFLPFFDSEYGDLIFCYGIIGFISVFLFWYLISRRINSYSRLFFINLLWIVSSSIVTSYRASFVFMLLLSILYSKQDSVPTR